MKPRHCSFSVAVGKMKKRLFDLVVATLGLMIFSIPITVIALAKAMDDGLSVIFRQKRLGWNLVLIDVYKFRSLRNDKITRRGHWLCVTGLDEVLQFVNVLNGDMNLVGPRPLTPNDLQRLDRHGFVQNRLHTKPGVTGLAQLVAGKGSRASLFLEREYLQNHSLWLNIKIDLLSFLVNLLGKRIVRLLLGK